MSKELEAKCWAVMLAMLLAPVMESGITKAQKDELKEMVMDVVEELEAAANQSEP